MCGHKCGNPSYNSGYGLDMLTCVFVCVHVVFMRPCFSVFVDFIVFVFVCVCVFVYEHARFFWCV